MSDEGLTLVNIVSPDGSHQRFSGRDRDPAASIVRPVNYRLIRLIDSRSGDECNELKVICGTDY